MPTNKTRQDQSQNQNRDTAQKGHDDTRKTAGRDQQQDQGQSQGKNAPQRSNDNDR